MEERFIDYDNISYDGKSDDEVENNGFNYVNNRGDVKKRSLNDPNNPNGYERPEASEIPKNEQTLLVDSPKMSLVLVGDPIDLVLGEETADLFVDGKKVGSLKPAFAVQLQQKRKGQYATCTLVSKTAPVMVKLEYSQTKTKNSILI